MLQDDSLVIRLHRTKSKSFSHSAKMSINRFNAGNVRPDFTRMGREVEMSAYLHTFARPQWLKSGTGSQEVTAAKIRRIFQSERKSGAALIGFGSETPDTIKGFHFFNSTKTIKRVHLVGVQRVFLGGQEDFSEIPLEMRSCCQVIFLFLSKSRRHLRK